MLLCRSTSGRKFGAADDRRVELAMGDCQSRSKVSKGERSHKRMSNRKRLSYLLNRDAHLCGIHVDGCGMPISSRAEASLDHIFTKSFSKDREDGIRPKHYNRDWNCQPMHQECNTKRGGQIYGFPLFTCSCHWLQIDRTSQGHILKLHYRNSTRKLEFPVSTENHNFVCDNISTGEYSSHFGDSSQVEVPGVWSMGQLKPGKKGITGKGQLGHAFPRVAPKEVQLFNLLEIQRVQGNSTKTIESFNRRMDPISMKVYFEDVETSAELDSSP